MLLPLVLPLLFLLLVLLLLLPFVLLRSVFVSAFEIKSVFLNEYYFLKKEREREHELPCLSLERTRKRYIRKNKFKRAFFSLFGISRYKHERTQRRERTKGALSSVHGRARARVKRGEREREILIACRGWMDPYIIPRSNFSQLSLSLSFLSSKILVRYLIRCFFALCARREPFGQST